MDRYQPPEQSMRGQFLDALFILVLLFATLFVTTYIAQGGGGSGGSESAEVKPISELPISSAEKQQFQKMVNNGMVSLETINTSIDANQPDPNKYNFSVLALIMTAGLLIAYLVFVYWSSFKEYREVIEEKFGTSEDN